MSYSSLPPPILIILVLAAVAGSGCLDPAPKYQESDDEASSQTIEFDLCYLMASRPEIHMYGCGEQVAETRLAPQEDHTEDFVIENLTGFSLVVDADPLATGTFRIRVGAFDGALDVRAGKWLATTMFPDPPNIEDSFRVLIDDCDATSATFAFESDATLPASLEVRLHAHAESHHFMSDDDGRIHPTCNSQWSKTDWPI